MLGHYVLYALMFEIGLFCNEHLRKMVSIPVQTGDDFDIFLKGTRMCDPHGAAEWHCGRYAHDPHPRNLPQSFFPGGGLKPRHGRTTIQNG